MQKVILPFILFWIYFPVSAQEVTILEAGTEVPVANVALYNKDKSTTAVSDLDGKTDLSPFSSNEEITFKHISYEKYTTTKAQLRETGNRVYLQLKAEELQEVVMSISKWKQQKKYIPQKIASISAQDIAFTQPQTAADLLQQSGKVFVQKSQLGGGSPMIRGFAANRVLLSVDGVRMNNAIFRSGNLQNIIAIDPFTVKNTEVIFGPGSVIYGSDAIGGVIHFYTKTPQFSLTDSLAFSANANYRFASANTENTAHIDVNLGHKKWASFTSFTYNHFGDLVMGQHGPDSYLRNTYAIRENGTDVLVENDNPSKQIPSGYTQINFLQKFAYQPNPRWHYDWGLYYSETSDYDRYDRLLLPDSSGEGLRFAEWFYGPQKWFMGTFRLTQKGNNSWYDGLKLITAYQRFEESRNTRVFQQENRFTTEDKLDALSVNLDLENKKIGDLRLYYGAAYVFNKVYAKGYQTHIETQAVERTASRYPDGATWQTAAGYINATYPITSNFTLLSGLRYSHVWLNAAFDTTFFPFPFDTTYLSTGALTGSLGLSWFPKTNLQITLNGSTGFRAPNIDDIGKVFDSEPGAVVVPNPDLTHEYAYNVEVGIRKQFNNRWTVSGAAYYTYLTDALVRRDFTFNGQPEIDYNGTLSTVQAIQNAARAYVYGFELGLEASWAKNWSFVSNLTFTKGVEEEDDGTDSPARHAAPTFGDAHIIWQNQKLKADLFLNYNSEISNEALALSEQSKPHIYAADSNGNPYAPSWYTLNFRSQYQFSKALQATAVLENITNQRYRTYSSGIVAPGINLIVALGCTF